VSGPRLVVQRPGLFDTIQDLGRTGFQELGMPVAGALDPIGLRLANALVGNPEGTAGIEIGVMGPELRVEAESVRVAAVGPFTLEVVAAEGEGPKLLESNRSHVLKRGALLRIGMIDGASTAYLAIEGGLAIAPFMGSLATYARAGLGGLDGRKLAAGDALPLARAAASARDEKKLARPFDYGSGPVRVVLGPQDDFFTPQGIEAFLGGEYVVTREADRMGIRFDGPKIEHAKGWDILSDGIAYGAIQVPGAGLPIVLLADRQTLGGYPKIACVASADLPRLGRLLPGHRVRFEAVGVDDAEALRRDLEKRVRAAIAGLEAARPEGGVDLGALYHTNLISGVVGP
jgi:biotin-dependent carboxylase-like uncharacterized protein